MNDNRAGGMMLVAGSVAGLITMGFHPAGPHGLPSPPELQMLALHNRTIHGLGIASLPLIFLGALALTRRLAGAGRLPLAALVVYGFAAVAIMAAASMSGFVSSGIMSKLVAGDPALETRRLFLDYTFQVNQAFASVYVVGCAVAILLWSVAIIRSRRLSPGLGVLGSALALVILATTFSGHLTPDVHGFGLVVLAQSTWFILVGILLMRSTGAEDHQEKAAPPDASKVFVGGAS